MRVSGVLRALAPALAALTALTALTAPAALAAGSTPPGVEHLYAPSGNYCDFLRKEMGDLPEQQALVPLHLVAGGAAARAAHALLRATLVHALRFRAADVRLLHGPADLCRFVDRVNRDATTWSTWIKEANYSLSVAAVWRVEPCTEPPSSGRCAAGFHMGLGGHWLNMHGGRAPARRRLFARRADAAAAGCRAWDDLRRDDCQFLTPRDARLRGEVAPPSSDWPNCTCSTNYTSCIAVLVAVDEDEEATSRLVDELCARAAALLPATPLRLAPLRDSALRRALRSPPHSFLFVDYDWWTNASAAEGVRLAPPLPCADLRPACASLDSAVPVLVAPVKKMKDRVPRALGVLHKFNPSHETLRRVLRNESDLTLEEAACEAALSVLPRVRDWIACPENDVVVFVQTCGNDRSKSDVIARVVKNYYRNDLYVTPYFNSALVKCDDIETPHTEFHKLTSNWLRSQVVGMVVMGAGGSGLLPSSAAAWRMALLLGEAPEGGERLPAAPCAAPAPASAPAAACAASPSAARLLDALRWLLARCGWRRLAVLRDESRTHKWQNFSAAAGDGGETPFVVHEQFLSRCGEVDEEGVRRALDALAARDARVVVLDTGAAAAERVLRRAALAGMTARRGYAWLVLRAAGVDADWLPVNSTFEYVTLSGWWRGGPAPPELAGDRALRDELDKQLGPRWPPLAAPLVDALHMMMAGVERMLRRDPLFLHDRTEHNRLLLLEELKSNSVIGVAQNVSCGEEPLVFVHRWNASGMQLLGTWPEQRAGGGAGASAGGALCEAGVRDAAPCHTTRSGDDYTPACHDVAWAVVLCTLLLTPPALCAAASSRRARLRRRDRAVEQRLLALGGRSAAAAAALAAHAVPRAALELMDELGAGHYGSVRLAVLREPDSAPVAVAAKTPRADAAAAAEAEGELLREAALLATLRHEHVVRFAGVCFEGAPLVLMEHAFHGDLRRYLRARRPLLERVRAGVAEPEAAHVAPAALTRLAREAAAALGYLAHLRLVHRDVRAANCLVDARRSLKLADFGLARRLDEAGEALRAGAGEYLCRRRALFPVLWMAPESLARGVFSPATDVWGLGVLMLELATLGARPFGAWPAPRVLSHVRAGGAPPLPRDAAASTRGVAATCWRLSPRERPSAAELVAYLAAHPRALRPALAALDGDAGAAPAPATPDENIYFEEWTT